GLGAVDVIGDAGQLDVRHVQVDVVELHARSGSEIEREGSEHVLLVVARGDAEIEAVVAGSVVVARAETVADIETPVRPAAPKPLAIVNLPAVAAVRERRRAVELRAV